MAGGEGRRLRPLTDRTPKPMIRVAGRPMLERIVLLLVGHGIRHIYVAVNYMADAIVDHFGDGGRFGCRIEYLRETMAHGTGGALSLLPRPPSEPLIVMNGDLVTQVDIGRLLAFHAREGVAATLAARHYQTEIPYGVVAERAGRLHELVEKPTADYLINAGIYVLDPAVLSLVPKETFFPITDLFAKLLARQLPVAVYQVEEDWIDVGRRDETSRGPSAEMPADSSAPQARRRRKPAPGGASLGAQLTGGGGRRCAAGQVDDAPFEALSHRQIHARTVEVHRQVVHQCPRRPRLDARRIQSAEYFVAFNRVIAFSDQRVEPVIAARRRRGAEEPDSADIRESGAVTRSKRLTCCAAATPPTAQAGRNEVRHSDWAAGSCSRRRRARSVRRDRGGRWWRGAGHARPLQRRS